MISIFTDTFLLKQIYMVSLFLSTVMMVVLYLRSRIKRYANKTPKPFLNENELSANELLKYPDKMVKKPIEPSAVTFNGIIGFFFVLGLSGLLFLSPAFRLRIVSILSLLFAVSGEVCVSMLTYALTIKNDKNVIFAPQSVGLTGVVVEDIPASKRGLGFIRVIINGRVAQVKSLSVDEVVLTKGTQVRILYAYSDCSVVVERISNK